MDPIYLTERSIIDNFSTDFTREVAFRINRSAQKIDGEFLYHLVQRYKNSDEYKMIKAGYDYYDSEHDVLKRERMGLDDTGQLTPIHNVPVYRNVDNQYGKCVDQKKNYLFGRPVTIGVTLEDDGARTKEMQDLLTQVFDDKRFPKTISSLGLNAIIGGISSIYPYLTEEGEIRFKVFNALQGFPLWDDEEHTESPGFVRFYTDYFLEAGEEKSLEVIEFYNGAGIFTYHIDDGKPFYQGHKAYAYLQDQGVSIDVWGGKNPVVPFKASVLESPLIKRVKGLQDALNEMLSMFTEQMAEDSRNTILVVKNYGGTNLSTFRADLNRNGAVFVEAVEGVEGDVDSLTIEVNAENFKTIINILRQAIVDNARGFDGKDQRLQNNPNKLNIQSLYSDMDLEANGMEAEFQSSFDELLKLIIHWSGKDFRSEDITVTFDRDVLVNESEAIENFVKSGGQRLSQETLVRMHPWDDGKELERIQREEEAYIGAFPFPDDDPNPNGLESGDRDESAEP